MNSAVSVNQVSMVRSFVFDSFGVDVKIESNRQEILNDAEKVVRKSLLNWISPVENVNPDHTFILLEDSGNYLMFQNQKEIASGESKDIFLKFFDSMIRIAVAEYADGWVFLHAGVVSW